MKSWTTTQNRNVETQFTNLELSVSHHQGNYPKLCGKGAEVKDLFPALYHVWRQHYNLSLKHHMLENDMLYNQCEAQDSRAHHKDEKLLPDDDAILLAHHVDNVLVKYSLLANWAEKEGSKGRLVQCCFHTPLFVAHGTTRNISQSQKGDYHA